LENVQRYGKPVGGAEPGNGRAVTNGAHSQQRLAPLREHHAAELRRDFPELDDRRLALLADRLARLDAARAWLDEQGGIVRNKHGEPYPIVDRIEKWATSTERRLDVLAAERRAPIPVGDQLRDHLGDGGPTDAEVAE
jgi:hypothetical protein